MTGFDEFDVLSDDIHDINVEKGFWGDPVMMDKYVAKLALVHSEVTEILEALRKSQGPEAVTDECADVLIRLFDLHSVMVESGHATPGLKAAMDAKVATNRDRPPKHGHKWG